MNDTREQTNATEMNEALVQTAEQSNSKRPRTFLKNGDTGDNQENTMNNSNTTNEEDINKRSRRHERRRENDEEEKKKEEQEQEPPQPIIPSSVIRAEPKHREQFKHHGKLTFKSVLFIEMLLFSYK